MKQHSSILNAFVKLGSFLENYVHGTKSDIDIKGLWGQELERIVTTAKHHNGWYTEENMLFALTRWCEQLTEVKLSEWLSDYELSKNKPKKVAIIMAGNIPLVGFHDFLAALITGNSVLIKLSGNDVRILPFLAKYLQSIEPSLENKINFIDGKLENFEVVIATGSNNTSRYFEHYFGEYPHIIRKNRNSVAVLTGNESKTELEALGEDIFRYYGLGCRSVSKLFVPEDYDFKIFFQGIYQFNDIMDSIKYSNNYDYNKAVYLMSDFKLLDNGFLVLKEDMSYASPIASLFYEKYSSLEELQEKLNNNADQLQCIVANGVFEMETPFGKTQKPNLRDYADGIDTVEFLLKT